jgi:hypothetical protein
MLVLVSIGLLGGLITGISPRIPPVLAVVFMAGGAGQRSGGAEVPAADAPSRRSKRPYAIIGGLVLSFSFTLPGSALISLPGLPSNMLHYTGHPAPTVRPDQQWEDAAVQVHGRLQHAAAMWQGGKAPAIADITMWLNTPDGKPVDGVAAGREPGGPTAWDGYAATVVAGAAVSALDAGGWLEVTLRERQALYRAQVPA